MDTLVAAKVKVHTFNERKKEQNDKFYMRLIFNLNKFSQSVLELVILNRSSTCFITMDCSDLACLSQKFQCLL